MNSFKYDSVDIARHLLFECKARDIKDINNTKINKLLYCFYGLCLAIYGEDILTEIPKYFPYGPVFPRVFKKYDELTPLEISFKPDIKKIMDRTMETFGDIQAGKLSAWSHSDNSPWDKMKQSGASYSDPISPVDIMNYFKELNEKC